MYMQTQKSECVMRNEWGNVTKEKKKCKKRRAVYDLFKKSQRFARTSPPGSVSFSTLKQPSSFPASLIVGVKSSTPS